MNTQWTPYVRGSPLVQLPVWPSQEVPLHVRYHVSSVKLHRITAVSPSTWAQPSLGTLSLGQPTATRDKTHSHIIPHVPCLRECNDESKDDHMGGGWAGAGWKKRRHLWGDPSGFVYNSWTGKLIPNQLLWDFVTKACAVTSLRAGSNEKQTVSLYHDASLWLGCYQV